MKTTGNNIVITGGSYGIGLAMVREFAKRDNQIIIIGRREDKLVEVSDEFKNVTYIKGDVSDEKSVDDICEKIYNSFPRTNILINNAGYAHQYRLKQGVSVYQKAKEEIELNYLGPVLLIEKLLPLLLQQAEPAIVNVSSIAGCSPNINLPTYSASKAALHSFSQILRLTLSVDANVKVFEVLPPPVGPEFISEEHKGGFISSEGIAKRFIENFAIDTFEIRIGDTEKFYQLLLQSPERALLVRNGMAKV